MALYAQQIKEKREAMGRAHTTAVSLRGYKTAEEQQKFQGHVDEAMALMREIQGLEAQEQLAGMEGFLGGAADPEIMLESHASGAVSGMLSRILNLGVDVDVPRHPGELYAARPMRPRLLSRKEQMARYGLSPERHAEAFGMFLRSPTHPAETNQALRVTMREWMKGNPAAETHLHSLIDDTLGGFTVSEDFRAQIIKALPGFSAVRASGARVIQTSKPGVTFPSLGRALTNPKQYSSDLTQGDGNWKAEGATSGGTARTPQNLPTFGMERIPVHIWQPDPVELTQEILSDSDIDLEGLLADLFAETMGLDTDLAFFKGNGVNKPEGILNGGSSAVVVGDASTYATPSPSTNDNGFAYPRLVNIYTDLAAQYRQRAVWYMNSDTYGRLLSIEASDGHPIFPVNQPVVTLWGRPIYFTEFLDNGSSTSNVPILFGDPRYYVIVERRMLSIMRLVERYAPNVALLPTARIGGQLVLKEAFRRGTVQA